MRKTILAKKQVVQKGINCLVYLRNEQVSNVITEVLSSLRDPYERTLYMSLFL